MTRHVQFVLTPSKSGFDTSGQDAIVSTATDGDGTTLSIGRTDSGQLLGMLLVPGSGQLRFETDIIESFSSAINARIAISDSFIRVFLNDAMVAEFPGLE